MNDDLTFIDTNILVYAYDADAGQKHQIAQELLSVLWKSGLGRLSVQVLQEFYVTVTRKLPKPLASGKARDVLENYAAWEVYSPTSLDVLNASVLEESEKLSFWDAMIIVAAKRSGSKRLLSEDMQSGRKIEDLTITNPFL